MYVPICHRELGPATEYGRRFVAPAGHLRAELRGSMLRNIVRTRSRVTLIPLARRLPQIILTPENGVFSWMDLITDVNSSSLTSVFGSVVIPNSSRRLHIGDDYVCKSMTTS